jgi:hypothetical protein
VLVIARDICRIARGFVVRIDRILDFGGGCEVGKDTGKWAWRQKLAEIREVLGM